MSGIQMVMWKVRTSSTYWHNLFMNNPQHLLSANIAHLLSVQYILRWTQSIASPSGESKPSETRTSLDPLFKSTCSIVFLLVLAKYTFKMQKASNKTFNNY